VGTSDDSFNFDLDNIGFEITGLGEKSVVDSHPAAPTASSSGIGVGDYIGGRYEVHDVIGGDGQTGMGVVYVCHDKQDNAVYALKTFQDKFIFSEAIRNSFKQ